MSEIEWYTDEVFSLSKFLTPEECQKLIDMAEALGFEEATVRLPDGEFVFEEFRNNTRVFLEEPDLASALWERIEPEVPEVEDHHPVGLNPLFRIYRYEAGQHFDWHQDAPVELDDGQISCLTVLGYLSEGFEGGQTSFNDSYSSEPFEDFSIEPELGMAVCFVHSVFHKGEAVLGGRKYVLRTDVMYAPAEDVHDHGIFHRDEDEDPFYNEIRE